MSLPIDQQSLTGPSLAIASRSEREVGMPSGSVPIRSSMRYTKGKCTLGDPPPFPWLSDGQGQSCNTLSLARIRIEELID